MACWANANEENKEGTSESYFNVHVQPQWAIYLAEVKLDPGVLDGCVLMWFYVFFFECVGNVANTLLSKLDSVVGGGQKAEQKEGKFILRSFAD